MSAQHGPLPGEAPGFLDKPENVRWLLRAFYAVCALLVAGDLVAHRHVVHPWERLLGFYPLYGFVGIVVLVILAKLLRRAVMRPEDYYDAD
jgi:hypothetical protein